MQKIDLPNQIIGGDFTLEFDGQMTNPIAFNATRFDVLEELQSLSTIGDGNVDVTGADGGPWFVEFQGSLGATDVSDLVLDGSNLQAVVNAVVVETQAPVAPTNESQLVTVPAGATGGSFLLTFVNPDGGSDTTVPISAFATAAEVQDAIQKSRFRARPQQRPSQRAVGRSLDGRLPGQFAWSGTSRDVARQR